MTVALSLLPAIGACGACSAIVVRQMERANQDRVHQDLANLKAALWQYRTVRGAYPSVDAGLNALVEADILLSPPRDMWDRPYVYRLVSTDGGAPEPVVTSLGQDGVPDTADDVASRSTAFPPPPPSPGG